MSHKTPVRRKQPYEERTLTFDFSDKMLDSDALAGTPVVDVDGSSTQGEHNITWDGPQFDGSKLLNVRFKGGELGKNYHVSIRCVTQQGERLELDVILEVRDGVN